MSLNEHITESIPAYALGSLDEPEKSQVAAHLSECAICREELESYQAVVDLFPYSAPMAEPSPLVKQRLMARVNAAGKKADVKQASWWEKLGGWARQVSPAWSLASVVLVVALLASNLLLWQRMDRLSQAQAQTMRVVALSGSGATVGATGLIVISMDGEHGTLVVDRLPTLNDERQYQLWLIKDGMRTSGGVFSVSKDGYGSLWVKAPQPLASYASFGITIEPAGGSEGPTGPKVLGGDL